MSTLFKVLLGLALVVPMGAYVVGSLVGSASDPVSAQTAVVVPAPVQERVVEPGVRFERRPAPEPRPQDDDADDGSSSGDDGGDDAGDDGADDGAGGGIVDDNGVEVVTPEPQPVPPPAGDDDDDDDDGDDDDDDGDDDDDDGDDD